MPWCLMLVRAAVKHYIFDHADSNPLGKMMATLPVFDDYKIGMRWPCWNPNTSREEELPASSHYHTELFVLLHKLGLRGVAKHDSS